MADGDGHAISYHALAPGTLVRSSDGVELGRVAQVLDNPREHIFDGLVIDTAAGARFVDAPEVARIAERAVTLSIESGQAAELPEPSEGAPEYAANPRAGRLARFLGGGWRKRR